MPPADLARAVEDRGFHSLYLPEHTHLPVRADTPPALVEGVHLEDYRRSLDPFVALATAASVTERILLGTGVVLVAQHDPIVLAKQIATLDHLSGGRVVLGIGFGWNREEAADHGVPFGDRRAVAREHVLCMQALWIAGAGGVPRAPTSPSTRAGAGPSPSSSRGSPPWWVAGPTPGCSRPWPSTPTAGCPSGGRVWPRPCPSSAGPSRPRGRDPRPVRVVPFGTVPTDEKLAHYRALGIDEVVLRVPSGSADAMLAVLDAHAAFLERFGGDDERDPPDPTPRRVRTKPWSGGGREELAAAVRRLIGPHRDVRRPAGGAGRRGRAGRRPLADELESHVRPAGGPGADGPVRRAPGRPPTSAGTLAAAMPFDVVIGTCNPVALPIDIEFDPPKAIGRAVFTAPYEGAPGCVHGAVLAGAFDIMLTAANVIADGAGPDRSTCRSAT